ncbi:MAG: sigma factor-like helix-turn-helix DNA-binding protein [Eubacteriales bacterium]
MEVFDACMLLDFYGQLLTERMRSTLELHFAEDMSLAEIAEQENISRQAVHDAITRGRRSLEEYEAKLGLIKRFMSQQSVIRDAVDALEKNDTKRAHLMLSELMNTL